MWRDILGSASLPTSVGVGKTAACLTTLGHLKELGHINRTLVVAPLRVVYNTWPEEIKKWAPGLSYNILHGRAGGAAGVADIDLINPDSLHKVEELAGTWDTLVVDESSQFKRWSTKRLKTVRKMLPTFANRIIMTGTPTPESLAELHSQIYILDGGEALGKNVTVFRARYMQRGGWQGRQWTVRKDTAQELLEKVAPMVIRIDAESNLDMPTLIENNIWCDLTPLAAAQYKRLKRELALELETGSLLVGNAAALYGKLRQVCNGAVYHTDEAENRTTTALHEQKLRALEDIASELCGKHAIVLYQFKHDVPGILKALGPECKVISGDTPQKEVNRLVTRWNDGKVRYLVSHGKCLAHGLNLQHGGADMVFFGLPDSGEGYLQARARLWRQGQTSAVRIHRILMKETVEELQLLRLENKIVTQADFLAALKAHAGG